MNLRFPRIVPVLAVLAAGLLAATSIPARAANDTAEPDPDLVKDAGTQAIDSAFAEFFARKRMPQRFAILPVKNDISGGYFDLQVRNRFATAGSAGGFELYTRDDASWKGLLAEIKWGQEFGDTMDAETIQKFGKIKGVEGIMTVHVTGVRLIPDPKDSFKANVQVRISFQAAQVETGQILWGAEKIGIVPVPEGRHTARERLEQVTGEMSATAWGWILGGLVGFIVLLFIVARIRAAARPR